MYINSLKQIFILLKSLKHSLFLLKIIDSYNKLRYNWHAHKDMPHP